MKWKHEFEIRIKKHYEVNPGEFDHGNIIEDLKIDENEFEKILVYLYLHAKFIWLKKKSSLVIVSKEEIKKITKCYPFINQIQIEWKWNFHYRSIYDYLVTIYTWKDYYKVYL